MMTPIVSLLTAKVKHGYGQSVLPYFPMETTGDRIRTLRHAKGLSQQQLADALTAAGCPVSREAVSYWENGQTANIRNRTFRALVRILGTNEDYLLFGPDVPDRRRKGTSRNSAES